MAIDGRLEEHRSHAQENDVQRRPVEIEIGAELPLGGEAPQLRAGELDQGVEECESGWIVFEDEASDGERNADEVLILVHQRLPDGITIDWNNRSNPEISFRPSGLANYDAGTFTLCDRRGSEHARAIIISLVGRVRAAREQSDGDPLEC